MCNIKKYRRIRGNFQYSSQEKGFVLNKIYKLNVAAVVEDDFDLGCSPFFIFYINTNCELVASTDRDNEKCD